MHYQYYFPRGYQASYHQGYPSGRRVYNQRGYEPPEWERYEQQFHPKWLKEMEAQLGIQPGREPLWWERFEEQFEPPWLQRMERQMGFPQPYDPRYDRHLF